MNKELKQAISEEGIDESFYKKLSNPKIKTIVTFYFNKEFNKEEVENTINLKSLYFKQLKDTKIINNKKLPGYIGFLWQEIDGRIFDENLSSLVNFLYNFKDQINNLLKKYNGEIAIHFNLFLTSFKSASLNLNAEMIKKMAELNINFDSSVDFFDYLNFNKI